MNLLQLILPTVLLSGPLSTSSKSLDLSAYAINSKTGEVLINECGDTALIPASCIKLLTTGAALCIIGPQTQFQTDLEYDGTIDDAGTLHGNLYIRGGGDPCLGSDRIFPSLSWKDQITTWCTAIDHLGICKIKGSVIGDASKWEASLAVPSWPPEDTGNYYGAGACALSFHENFYTLSFKPGDTVGNDTSISHIDPPLQRTKLINEVKTGPIGSGDQACIYGPEFSTVQYARGTIPAGVNIFSIKGAIPNPPETCASLLSKALTNKGISIENQPFKEDTKRISFHTTLSPPIKDIVYWANQKSINLYTEHLLKKMGEIKYGQGSTVAGIKALKDFWEAQGVNLNGAHIEDGSGLSRKNQLSAKQLVSVLLAMKDSDLFFLSLPEQDKNRRAKSGTMTSIKGLAGWENEIAFAIFINNASAHESKEKVDVLLSKLHK